MGLSYLPDELRAGDYVKVRKMSGKYGDSPALNPWRKRFCGKAKDLDSCPYLAHNQFGPPGQTVGLDPDWSFTEIFPAPGINSPPPPPPEAPPAFFGCESCAVPGPLLTINAAASSSGLPLIFAKYMMPVGLCKSPIVLERRRHRAACQLR